MGETAWGLAFLSIKPHSNAMQIQKHGTETSKGILKEINGVQHMALERRSSFGKSGISDRGKDRSNIFLV